jgi:SAM-dependent methyltransferase
MEASERNMKDSDKEWEKWGQNDPYYGVITLDKFHKKNLSENSIKDFFKSGADHIQFVIRTIQTFIDTYYSPTRALDFGCGVGRCLLSLASICDSVIGVDVSPAMLREAMRNCSEHSITNVELFESDDNLSKLNGTFDLIHSAIVFQHIPPKRGEFIFSRLLEFLTDGGVASIQFLYDRKISALVKILGRLRRRIPLFHNFVNLLYGHHWSDPLMEKNVYNLNRLLAILHKNGCDNVHLSLFGKHELFSVMIFAQKKQLVIPFDPV